MEHPHKPDKSEPFGQPAGGTSFEMPVILGPFSQFGHLVHFKVPLLDTFHSAIFGMLLLYFPLGTTHSDTSLAMVRRCIITCQKISLQMHPKAAAP